MSQAAKAASSPPAAHRAIRTIAERSFNTLYNVVADMDFKTDFAARGYQEGFFSQLERLIWAATGHVDAFKDVDYLRTFKANEDAKYSVFEPGMA